VVVVTSRFISMKTCNLLISVLLYHLLPHIIFCYLTCLCWYANFHMSMCLYTFLSKYFRA
jgi:hypothetical protein